MEQPLTDLIPIRDAARQIGVAIWRLRYAAETDRIPTPRRFGHNLVLTPAQLEVVREYFERIEGSRRRQA